jgi:hypothetical protein
MISQIRSRIGKSSVGTGLSLYNRAQLGIWPSQYVIALIKATT